MQTTIGLAKPFDFDRTIEAEALDRFEAGMAKVLSRRDQVAKATAWATAVPSCTPGEPFTVKALRREAPSPRLATYRELRQFLDGGGWDVDRLRVELVACGMSTGVEAVLIETCEVRYEKRAPFDVVSLHLLGPERSVPVGWQRVPLTTELGEETSPAEGERRSVRSLLSQLQGDYRTLGSPAIDAPVVSLDYAFGEAEAVRADLAELGLEHILAVGPEYAGFDQPPPYERQAGLSVLCDQLPFLPSEPPPPPEILNPEQPPERREYIVPFRHASRASYAIANAWVPSREGQLSGYRTRERASDLGDLLGRVIVPDAARNLHLADFHHHNEEGWNRGAFVLSALQTARLGLFPTGSG